MATTTIANRYVLEDSLGQGGMGEVYRALDTLEGRRVALKLLKPAAIAAERSFFQFKQEFRAALGLRHPHLVQVFDFGQDHGAPFFTMELVEGPGLEVGAPWPVERASDVIAQVLLALELIHSRGMLHRDLKPDNVRFTATGELKILDLGLLEPIGTQRHDHVNGTMAYMPPEALLGRPLAPSADLYSVGVMAYELLGGRHPFAGVGAHQLAQAILAVEPTPLAELAPDVPAPLAELVAALLAKDPAARPQRATDVARALTPWLGAARVEEGRRQAYTYLLSPALVGRRQELAVLTGAIAGLALGAGSTVLVGAHAGVGKSRLVQEAKLHCQLGGRPFLTARCAFEGARPYGLLRQVLQAVAALAAEPEIKAHRALLDQLWSAGAGQAWPPAIGHDKEAFHARVAAFIAAVATRTAMAVFVDDLQWADTLSLEALAACWQGHRDVPMLWLGTYRLDEVGPRHMVAQALHEGSARSLTIGPFDLDEVGELVRAMLGTRALPEGLLPLLVETTQGNGFFVSEMLRDLVDRQALRYVDGQWRFALPGGTVGLPSSLERLIAQRLERLSEPAQALARLGAVLGDDVTAPVLESAGLGEQTLLDAINDLIEHQVWVRLDDGYRFAHDRIRESIYQELDAQVRRELHETLGTMLEANGARSATLAYHFSAGRSVRKGVHRAREAGCEAEAVGAMHEAFRHWRHAATVLEAHPAWREEALLVALWLDLGTKCGFSVDSRVGEESLDKALAVLGRLGRPELAARVMGLSLRAIKQLPGAWSRPILARLSKPVPFKMPTGWRRWLPPNYLALIPVLIESYTYLTICCNTNGKIGKALEVNRRGQKLVPDRESWAWGVVMTAYAYARVLEGRFSESVAIARDAFRLLKDETALQAIDMSCGALVLANNQVYEGAPIDAALTAELLERASAHRMTEWEGMVQYAPMVHYALTGRRRQAIAAIEAAQPFSRRCGRHTVLEREIVLATARIRTVVGEFDDALAAIEYGLGLDAVVAMPYFSTRLIEVLGRVRLEQGRLDEAAAAFSTVIERETAYGIRFSLPECHMGLSEVARRTGDLAAAESHWHAARAILDDAPYDAAFKRLLLQRQRGKLEVAAGRPSSAREALERGLTLAERLDNPWQAALLWTDLGMLAMARGAGHDVSAQAEHEAREAWERALALYQDTENAHGLKLVRSLLATVAAPPRGPAATGDQELDRLAVLQRFSLALDGATTEGAVFDTLLTHAMDAIGADRGAILRVRPHRVEVVVGREGGATTLGHGPSVSHTVVREAMATGAPQLVADALEDADLARQASVMGQALRTLICLPMGDDADDLALYADRGTALLGGLDQGHVWVLQSLAHFGRMALAHARLIEQSRARADRLQMLNQVSALVSSSLELSEILAKLLGWVLELTGAEAAVVVSTGPTREILGALGEGAEHFSRSVVDTVVSSRAPLCVLDAESEDAIALGESVQAMKVRSVMCVPLLVSDRVLGVLHVSSKASSRSFSEQDLELLRAIAANSAMAIHNARQLRQIQEKRAIEHELSIAQRIQQGFYPERLPPLEGLSVSGTCQAAREVGGDFYDVIPLEDGRVALTLGDVSGKSVSAALYMAVARTAIRMALGHGASPRRCLSEVNARITADISDGSFITCFMGVYDPATRSLAYASAGHHLSMLLRPEGPLALSTRGLPLGMDHDAFEAILEERTVPLAPGDRLVLFTDGVIEALSPTDEEFGEEKLLDELVRCATIGAEASVAAVIASIERHVDVAMPFDDMTILVADVLAPTGVGWPESSSNPH